MARWKAIAGLGALLVGCGEPGFCTSACPKIEGTYQMAYEALATSTPDCSALRPVSGPETIAITRSGAELRATLYGVPGRGTLRDTSDFAIATAGLPTGSADAGVESYVLRGYFIPPVERPDGGEPGKIMGKWISRTDRGGKICEAQWPYTGVQQ